MFRSHPNWCHEKTGIPYNQNKYVWINENGRTVSDAREGVTSSESGT
jgi:hypothetical protein